MTDPLPPDLPARIRAGSLEALETLYRAVARRLYAPAWRLTLDRADAEDVVHDLLGGLPRALEGYQERAALRLGFVA